MSQHLPTILDALWNNQDYRGLVHRFPVPTPAKAPLPELLHCLLLKGESHLQLEETVSARDTLLDAILVMEKRGRERRLPQMEFRALLGLIRANRLGGEPAKALQLLSRLRESRTVRTVVSEQELMLERGWSLLATGSDEAATVPRDLAEMGRCRLTTQGLLDLALLEAALLQREEFFSEALAVLSSLRDSAVIHLLSRARLSHTRGILLQRLQRYREASDSLERALAVYDHYQMQKRVIELRTLRARLLFQLGERQEAVRQLRTTRARAYELDLPLGSVLRVAEEFDCELSREGFPLRSLLATQAIPGFSPVIRELNDRIRQVAGSSLPVLILGETGVGKELTARAIHASSNRSQCELVTIHCPSLSETLFESTLFGHRRGAFTGATADRQGLAEQAEGGTLFLDEISEISPPIQAKLLRFLETGEYHVVGDNRVRRAEMRLLAASNHTYRGLLEDQGFRSDLLHRIAGAIIRLPSLQERREDIPLLLESWLLEWNAREGVRKIIAPAAIALLQNYHFPGNVRELRHLFQGAWEQASSNIRPEHFAIDRLPLPGAVRGNRCFEPGPLRQALSEFEKGYLQRTLQEVHFDKSHASRLLQISRQTLYTKLKQHGLLEAVLRG